MDTLNRNKGDVNSSSFPFQTNTSSKQQVSISQQDTEKTKSLSIISNNHVSLVEKDILALDDQIDNNLFHEELKFQILQAEKKEFESIDQIENQRLLIQFCQNRWIKIGMLINTYQIIVIKEMLFQQEEEFIKMLDEFKIQNKLNNLFPQQSLQLFKPVKVQKLKGSYGMMAAMEKAETNLFIYSQKNKISSSQAYTIYRVILKQLINMHSIQIAHRDVKPQNIFYVIDKGWLLSDFGESQEYQELEQLYNIRGTLNFLMPNIQMQVHQSKQILQNLLVNDLYALVVSMIVIQKIQDTHKIDISQEIQNLNDYYLIETLKIQTYKELIEFDQQLDEVKEEIQFNFQDNYYKQLNSKEEQMNQQLNYESWIELCSFYLVNQIYPKITNQLFQLINNNFRKICNILKYGYGKLLEILYVTKKIINFEQIYLPINISSMRMEQLELTITLMFNFGYSETTLKYCEQILMKQYNQFIHLKLIDCLERLLMFSEAIQQFKQFKQGLIFDQLNTAYQKLFLLKLKYYEKDLIIDPDYNLDQLLIKQCIQLVNPTQLEKDIKQYNQFEYKNVEIIVNLIKKYLLECCGIYNPYSIHYGPQVLYLIQFYDINIESQSLEFINNERLELFDSSRRISILFNLAKIYCFQDKKIKLQKTIKLIQREMFKAESWQQKIAFQISIIILKLNKMYSQNQTKHSQIKSNYITDRLYQLMLRINKVSFNLYISLIEEYLLYFLQIQHNNQCITLREIKIVIQIINFISKNKFYQKSFHMFQYYHVMVQSLLIMKYNHKRCLILIKDNEDWLTKSSLSHFKTQMILKLFAFSSVNYVQRQQKQFLLFQFLHL